MTTLAVSISIAPSDAEAVSHNDNYSVADAANFNQSGLYIMRKSKINKEIRLVFQALIKAWFELARSLHVQNVANSFP